jgi:hypothetical protein
MIDSDGVLIGVPSNAVVDADGGERQNYARPLSLLPTTWVELLRDHGADIR